MKTKYIPILLIGIVLLFSVWTDNGGTIPDIDWPNVIPTNPDNPKPSTKAEHMKQVGELLKAFGHILVYDGTLDNPKITLLGHVPIFYDRVSLYTYKGTPYKRTYPELFDEIESTIKNELGSELNIPITPEKRKSLAKFFTDYGNRLLSL